MNSQPHVTGARIEPLGNRPLIMGILNLTPDSFSDGGRYTSVADGVARGIQLAADGADIIDVGGESTRPGALPVSAEEQRRRVIPVIESLSRELPARVKAELAPVVGEVLERAGYDPATATPPPSADEARRLALAMRVGALAPERDR